MPLPAVQRLHPKLTGQPAPSCPFPAATHPCSCPPCAAAEVKNTATRLGYVWQSTGCDSFYWQRVGRRLVKAGKGGGSSVKYSPGVGPAVPQECPESGSGFQMGGPFWAERLHDPEWVAGLLAQVKRDKDM